MPSVSAFIFGQENMGWSIDADRKHTIDLLNEAVITTTKNLFSADVIHFVWWNQAEKFRHIRWLFRKKKWLAVVTNSIREDTAGFQQLKTKINFWVAANKEQLSWLEKQGVPCGYQPFYVDERVFHPIDLDRAQLCRHLGIDYEILKEKFLIGSFQRDSLGSNLSQPKWQKGPDILLSILAKFDVPRDKWLLVLAGPRRHWIVDQCRRERIPYLFVGIPPVSLEDDMHLNTLGKEQIALLYNLVDLYVVSSKLEGGPKAIIEAGLCRRPVISTSVGLAPDLLVRDSIYRDVDEAVHLMKKLVEDANIRQFKACENFNKIYGLCNRNAAVARWADIYNRISQL